VKRSAAKFQRNAFVRTHSGIRKEAKSKNQAWALNLTLSRAGACARLQGHLAVWLWSHKIYELSDTRIHLANKLVSILEPQRRNVGGKFFIKLVVAVNVTVVV